MTAQSQYDYGCFFCRTGCENRVAKQIELSADGVEAIAPVKVRHRKCHGVITEEKVTLFPGYVFFRSSSEEFSPFVLQHKNDCYTLLTDTENDWRLYGDDLTIVRSMFDLNGVIGLSCAYFVGNRIRIKNGFLKDHEGSILKVNKYAQTVQVRIRLSSKEFLFWLGYELIDEIKDADT